MENVTVSTRYRPAGTRVLRWAG